MSGHSKWATTKRQKAVTDAKRGAIFTKLSNIITIAAREKGGDPDTNFSLRMAIDKARTANMPKDNIERAIKRGTGELAGAAIEELVYEGLGPAKSQFIVKCLTDNKNRAAANIRHLFAKHGGAFGSVMWNFGSKGVIRIAKDELTNNKLSAEEFELELIDAGAQDILKEEEGVTIYTKIEDLQKVKKFLEEKNIKTESAEIEYIAKEDLALSGEDKERVEKFIEELEDNEDAADYYHNINNI
ncbi:YebC/PmpR family DNA-binding transcriptional regulator [Candidatus Parcubacteria bacterium]|nr:YebC/PmpR family DNA-binding transcriptional regulator [Patescibacteria group bacterium]MCG2690466.1 YebC/PmpR family DNA-binding transcriptional regulator [Candidatus Parcubacteria bacterium]